MKLFTKILNNDLAFFILPGLTLIYLVGFSIGKHTEAKFNTSIDDASRLMWLHSGADVGYRAAVAGMSTNRLHVAIDEAWKELQ